MVLGVEGARRHPRSVLRSVWCASVSLEQHCSVFKRDLPTRSNSFSCDAEQVCYNPCMRPEVTILTFYRQVNPLLPPFELPFLTSIQAATRSSRSAEGIIKPMTAFKRSTEARAGFYLNICRHYVMIVSHADVALHKQPFWRPRLAFHRDTRLDSAVSRVRHFRCRVVQLCFS